MQNKIIRQSPAHIFGMVEHHCAYTTKTVWHLDYIQLTEIFPIHPERENLIYFLFIIFIHN